MAPIRVRLSVTTAEAAIDAAITGTGVTRLISYQVAAAVARGELLTVLAQYEREPMPSASFMQDKKCCTRDCGGCISALTAAGRNQW